MKVIDKTNLEASKLLDFLSYAKFETSASNDLSVMLTTTSGWQHMMKFPDVNSPELK